MRYYIARTLAAEPAAGLAARPVYLTRRGAANLFDFHAWTVVCAPHTAKAWKTRAGAERWLAARPRLGLQEQTLRVVEGPSPARHPRDGGTRTTREATP